MSLALLLLLLALAGATPALGEGPAALCLPGPNSTPLILAAEGLREWPSGDLVWTAGPLLTVTLGCAPGRVALGLAEGKQGRLLPFALEEGQWQARPPGQRLRGAPRAILSVGERWAVLAERKGTFTLYLVDPDPETRPLERPLPGRPASLALSADGSTLLVALGREVRTFTLDQFRSSVTFLFPEPIDHLAGRPGVARLLVARDRHLAAVDPGDTPTRGSLPVRAETDLPGTILNLAWAGRGEIALALVATPPAVLFLSGDDLSLLERHDLDAPARALATGESGRALVLLADGAVTEITPRQETRERARAPEPSPPPDPVRDRPRVTPAPDRSDPPPPTPTLQRKRRARPETKEPAPEPAPEPSPSVAPPTEPPPSLPPQTESPPSVPPPTEPPLSVTPPTEPPPSLAPLPEPREEPAAAPTAGESRREAPTRATPPPAPPAPRKRPVSIEPETEAVGEPSPPGGWTLPDGPPLGGTVMGRLTGLSSLVAEVVLLGPNNLLLEAARVPPRRTPGDGETVSAAFLAGELPPGRYRVVPMGPDGASLACRPPFATVTVTAEEGARANFEVIGRR